MAASKMHLERLTRPAYLRFAVPGLALVALSGLLWDHGEWWRYLLLMGGLALIILPLPPRRTGQGPGDLGRN